MPYGEILENYEKVNAIVEKTKIYHLINAGVYVIEKKILKILLEIKIR